MTKKNYIAAAAMVSNMKWDTKIKPAERKRMAEMFVKFFQNDNPRFSETRFLEACQLGDRK